MESVIDNELNGKQMISMADRGENETTHQSRVEENIRHVLDSSTALPSFLSFLSTNSATLLPNSLRHSVSVSLFNFHCKTNKSSTSDRCSRQLAACCRHESITFYKFLPFFLLSFYIWQFHRILIQEGGKLSFPVMRNQTHQHCKDLHAIPLQK